jgi:hypothetical protein
MDILLLYRSCQPRSTYMIACSMRVLSFVDTDDKKKYHPLYEAAAGSMTAAGWSKGPLTLWRYLASKEDHIVRQGQYDILFVQRK